MTGNPRMSRRDEKNSDDKWMQHAVHKPGALREALHIKSGHNIPIKKLEKATHSDSPLMRKRASLALTFRKYRP